MKRILFISLLLLTAPIFAVQQYANPIGKIISYGIYSHASKGVSSWSNATSTNHKINENVESQLEKQTSEIPIVKDIYFAFSYEIVGLPDGLVPVDWTVKHPKMVKPDGTESTGYTYKRPVFVKDGVARGTSGYALSEAYEMVPGEWVFTYSYGGKTLVEQKFFTVKP